MSFFSSSASVKVAHLTPDELNDLRRFEASIQQHVATFATAGLALRAIRDRQLYRTQFESFEAYVKEKWHFTPQHANRLIAAAAVATNLEPTGLAPVTERQVRPLATLTPAEQLATWSEAVEVVGEVHLVTGPLVESLVKKRKKTATKRLKPISLKVPGARIVITPTKAFTSAEDALRSALAKLDDQAARAA